LLKQFIKSESKIDEKKLKVGLMKLKYNYKLNW